MQHITSQDVAKIMAKLKPFQRATVEQIDRLFRNHDKAQRRVLVADEVGLGKTLIARGVIAKLALLRQEEHDELFKVAYICSNQAIARQNIQKLKICSAQIDNSLSNCRLSMQHLRTLELEDECLNYILLTPLTPATSFQMTNGQGTIPERALICAVLKQIPDLIPAELQDKLADFLRYGVKADSWNYWCQDYRKRIEKVHAKHPNYPSSLANELAPQLIAELIKNLEPYVIRSAPSTEQRNIIIKLRQAFTLLSANRLEPDLVIMDEFQRFKTLLDPVPNSEMATITDKFLNSNAPATSPRVLLLSATPYKPYATLEEIEQNNCDAPPQEFAAVIKFLQQDQHDQHQKFNVDWNTYSQQLRQLKNGQVANCLDAKTQIEQELYNAGLCRTERISFVAEGDFLQKAASDLTVESGDIDAFCRLNQICTALQLNANVPYDYVKSSPLLLSFMDYRHYKFKKILVDAAKKNNGNAILKDGYNSPLWLYHNRVNTYQDLNISHAKYKQLSNSAFEYNAATLLWLPPAMPYYQPEGNFKAAQSFSKLLVFSSWEMVPKMIATLLSYECERQTMHAVDNKLRYFQKYRYPLGKPEKIDYSHLWKNCSFLEKITWLPDASKSVAELIPIVEEKIQTHLGAAAYYPSGTNPYAYLLDVLDDQAAMVTDGETLPDNWLETLAQMTIAAPGICLSRALHAQFKQAIPAEKIAELAQSSLAMFYSPEGEGAVLKALGYKAKDLLVKEYPRLILQYCLAGNFQAMVDEYVFILLNDNPNGEDLINKFNYSLNLRTSSYDVDYHPVDKNNYTDKMRSHYAVCLNEGTVKERNSEVNKTIELSREEGLRVSFNSPFRPFVLASTSVGQEGLDFHYYCRKIMHWNLPSNPTDLEQREGRINRYMCLAVRQSLVQQYPQYSNWQALVDNAEKDDSGLTPFWCFKRDQKIKIVREVPLYPFSNEVARYERLKQLLALYRLTLGQERQEELLEGILNSDQITPQECQELFMNLCPFLRKSNSSEVTCAESGSAIPPANTSPKE